MLWFVLIYLAVAAVFYFGTQTRGPLVDVAMAFFWPLTLVALVVWSFLGDEDEAL